MSKLVGMLRGRKIYEDDARLVQLRCDVEYFAVYPGSDTKLTEVRCDHCGRTNRNRTDCESCGAPL